MPLYRLSPEKFEALPSATFEELGIKERVDLQRLLRANIGAIAQDCLVIAEEFSHWEDSKRRIDLLAIDRTANLVVIELKRDEDGGHMELQALRYAAMVSTMTFEDVVETHARFLKQSGSDDDARARILDFLDWSSADEGPFAKDVRIVLASSGFSPEITTSVLWLNQRTLDIRCVHIKPYRLGSEVVLDVQQVLPLPQAQDYQVQLRQKVQEERFRTEANRDFTRYDLQLPGQSYTRLAKREFVLRVIQHAVRCGATPEDIANTAHHNPDRLWRAASGNLTSGDFIALVQAQLESEGRQFNPRRFFCENDELFHIYGETYALTNQWGGQGVLDTVNALVTKYGNGEIAFQPSLEAAS